MPQPHSAAATEIGRRLRAARTEIGISLEDLGDLSLINWTTIGKIERGVSSPTVESLIRITTALGIEAGALLNGITADAYGARPHQLTARDLIAARQAEQQPGATVAD